jgi:hypothetical protein
MKSLLFGVLIFAASAIAQVPASSNGLPPETWIAGAGGVTANTCVIKDTSSPALIIAATGTGCYGIALGSASAGSAVLIQRYGIASCVADGPVSSQDIVIPGTTTPNACKDSGQSSTLNIPVGTRRIGTALTSAATAGALFPVSLSPDQYGGQFSKVIQASSPAYGVLANVQWAYAAVWNNSSSSVTTGSSDPPFFSTDVGKKMFGTGNCNGTQINCALQIPVGTISSYVSAHSVTVSTTSTAACTSGQCNFFWGNDDTAGLVAAANAMLAAPGSTLQLPCGGMFVDAPPFRFTSPHPASGIVIMGCGNSGSSSVIIPTPDFSWTGVGTTGAIFYDEYPGASNEAFSAEDQLSNFTVWGGGTGSISGPASGAAVISLAQAVVSNVWVDGWGWSTSNLTGISLNGVTSLFSSGSNGSGAVSCTVVQNGSAYGGNYMTGDSFCGSSSSYSLSVVNGSLVSFGNQFYGGTGVSVGAQFVSTGDTIDVNSGNSITVLGAGALNASSDNIYGAVVVSSGSAAIRDSQLNANASAGGLGMTGGTARASGTTFTGNSTYAGLNLASGSPVFLDLGGNSYSGGSGSTASGVALSSGAIRSPGLLPGTCSGTATSSVSGGLYLYNLGGSTATTCTIAALLGGQVMYGSGTLANLNVTAGTGGVSSSSGVVTVYKNGSATAITCTLGTGTACTDNQHTVTYAIGDIIAIGFTTKASETLANVNAQVWAR